jgi:hypothetical protein
MTLPNDLGDPILACVAEVLEQIYRDAEAIVIR